MFEGAKIPFLETVKPMTYEQVADIWNKCFAEQAPEVSRHGYQRDRGVYQYLDNPNNYSCLPQINGKKLDDHLVEQIKLRKRKGENSSIELLDVGCGEAFAIREIAERIVDKLHPKKNFLTKVAKIIKRGYQISITGIDAVANAKARSNLDEFREGDIQDLANEYHDRRFDTIMSSCVAYHLPDPFLLFIEQSQLLKTNGIALNSSILTDDYDMAKARIRENLPVYDIEGKHIPPVRVFDLINFFNSGKYKVDYKEADSNESLQGGQMLSGKIVIEKLTDGDEPLDCSYLFYTGSEHIIGYGTKARFIMARSKNERKKLQEKGFLDVNTFARMNEEKRSKKPEIQI